ncbi:hypothetical protein [Salinarimonas sp.]|uniref:hypothetical protein n=1 Tax=Salinarimonas sp. TaxID=2766526 RepID=UPI00391C23D3
MSHSLLSLFMPPDDDHTGDFGMLCGFTASRDVLERIARTFSGDGSRPHLAAFIHPNAGAVTDIPGIAWMHFRNEPFNLLHAKVALLGFRRRGADGEGDGYRLRLAVSTGNWTAEPLTTSIDMFWCGEIAVGARDPQLVADIRAADGLFGWLRGLADDSLLRQTFDGHLPDAAFREAIESLPDSRRTPRFVDTRTQTMRRQLLARLPRSEMAYLAIGSGYWEASEEDAEAGLLERLRKDLVRERRLAKGADRDLVVDPDNCQGLYAQAAALDKKRWRFRKPASKLHGDANVRLHAKFLFISEQAGSGAIGESRLYIGSANFSRAGFESTAEARGNLEAGIVLAPDPELSWRGNAVKPISKLLPGDFGSTVEIGDLAPGEPFVAPLPPPPPPPVTFLEWADGELFAPAACKVPIDVLAESGAIARLPCPWPAPPPAFVTLRPSGWRVPVRADGALVVPKRGPVGLEDILAGLGRFPAAPIAAGEDEEEPDAEIVGEMDDVGADGTDPARAYPVRQMMRLVVRLAERQKDLDPRDWQRWCRELGQDLPRLVETEAAMIAPFVAARANPLTALADPEFLPEGVNEGALAVALDRIAAAWGLDAAEDLWERRA